MALFLVYKSRAQKLQGGDYEVKVGDAIFAQMIEAEDTQAAAQTALSRFSVADLKNGCVCTVVPLIDPEQFACRYEGKGEVGYPERFPYGDLKPTARSETSRV